MRRAFKIAFGALCGAVVLAGGPAAAQFRATPMVIPAPATESTVVAQPFTRYPAPDSDLLLLYPTAGSSVRRPHESLTTAISWTPALLPFGWVRAGRLAPLSGDAIPDVAYCSATEMRIAFGPTWTVATAYTGVPLNASPAQAPTLSFAHLLARAGDFIVMPQGTGISLSTAGRLWALDFDPVTKAMSMTSWPVPMRTFRMASLDEVLPMRIGANARALGIDDLYMLGQGSVTIFENLSTSTATSLVGIALATGIRIGGSGGDVGIPYWVPPWLPAGVPNNDAQGAGPLNYYGHTDGTLDLIVSLSSAIRLSTLPAGHLLAIRSAGTIASLAAATSWEDLNGHPDLMLSDPVVARPLVLGGAPAVAVWDRGLDQILVIRASTTPGRLLVWRGEARGHQVRDIFLADLVGSASPELVADATGIVPSGVTQPSPVVLVYPDLGDASPVVAWAPGSPGTLSRGEDHAMTVSASDPDGPFTVQWFVGNPWAFSPPAPVTTGSTFTLPGLGLCLSPPQSVDLTVRAIDAFGVWDEITADLDVVETAPRIAIAGASPPDRLVLGPRGTAAAVFEGSAWSRCPVSLAWGATTWPTAATVTADAAGANPTRQTVVLPEAAYPELLSRPAPVVSLTATDPALPAPVTVKMPVGIDATGLALIEHSSDVSTMREGDVAVLRTRLRSQTGVALPGVRVVASLTGLAPAGSPRATGAAIVETESGGTVAVLDGLPPVGAEVVVELPVRATGTAHASAAEARSSGGHLLTPAAGAPAASAPLPGCGCGSTDPAALSAGLLLLALARPRRTRIT